MWGFLAAGVVVGRLLLSWRRLTRDGFGLGSLNRPLLVVDPVGDFAVLSVGHGLTWGCGVGLAFGHSWWLGVVIMAIAWPLGEILARGLFSRSIENAARLKGKLEARTASDRAVGRSDSNPASENWEEEDEDEEEEEDEDDGIRHDPDFDRDDAIPGDLRLIPERRDYRGWLGEPLCPICQSRMGRQGFCSPACALMGARYGIAPHVDAGRPWWASSVVQMTIGLTTLLAMAVGGALAKSCTRW